MIIAYVEYAGDLIASKKWYKTPIGCLMLAVLVLLVLAWFVGDFFF